MEEGTVVPQKTQQRRRCDLMNDTASKISYVNKRSYHALDMCYHCLVLNQELVGKDYSLIQGREIWRHFHHQASVLILPATVQKSVIRIFHLMVAGHKTQFMKITPELFRLLCAKTFYQIIDPPARTLLPLCFQLKILRTKSEGSRRKSQTHSRFLVLFIIRDMGKQFWNKF
ncbi:hypothetical protein CEXT_157691 [Caerostris extrusa]|uniref:Uncharacterized protein n=1 Tax=Caerostris extrusa TaxID=172846 RepID=A0AAV4PPW0_CAEEX|nr:hypothetical protein CEXT_157691 [Caerostris extrusa]